MPQVRANQNVQGMVDDLVAMGRGDADASGGQAGDGARGYTMGGNGT